MMNKNLTWHSGTVEKNEKVGLVHGLRNKVFWLTGLSGSGKSTIARDLEAKLHSLGIHSYVLDGDNIRHGLNSDLGFSASDREENIRRVSEVAKLFYDAGIFVIVSFISPYLKDREFARSLIGDDFIEVFVDCPLSVCEERDVKGLYAKARAGEIKDFTGISAPYETASNCEVRVDSSLKSVEECSGAIIDYLFLETAKDAAISAGKTIMEVYDDYDIETKLDNSPVTTADLKADKIIIEKLKGFGIPILTEESEDDFKRLDSSYVWIVDPLDGTKEFISKNGEFTVNIALVRDGKPVLGVICAPAIDEMYYALDGAYFNGKKIDVSDIDSLSDMVLMKSRSHADDKLSIIENKFRESKSRGSSLKGCNVASGDADVYIRFGNVHEWDICAMHCIVVEAGGKMTGLDGSDIVYNKKDTLVKGGFIVSNGKKHDELTKSINSDIWVIK